jgi:hypothetical protein
LTTLVNIRDSVQNATTENKLTDVIEEIGNFQSSDYGFTPDADIQKFIDDQFTVLRHGCPRDADHLNKLSLECELEAA